MRKIVIIAWIIGSALFWFVNFIYPNVYLLNAFYTVLASGIVYIVVRLFAETVVTRIQDVKTRYSFNKIIQIIYTIAFVAILATIWVENAQTVIVAYGVIGAGLAIALQDLFKNLAGGIIIYLSNLYSVGDRIEIESQVGDVIDIGILYTTIMEIQGWVAGDQATGRLIEIPNSIVLNKPIYNYTKDNLYIWDEITIPITYDSDWKKAYNKIQNIVQTETKALVTQANAIISKMEEKYYFESEKRPVEPNIFITLTDNWISFAIRYVSHAKRRRMLKDKLSQMILEEIHRSEDIKIASVTLDVVGFPTVKLDRKKQP